MIIKRAFYGQFRLDEATEWKPSPGVNILMGKSGHGKCLGVDTPVLMADGSIKSVQDVRTGDALMGPDSVPRFVLSTTSGVGPLYRVRPVKGDPYVVNHNHILSLRRKKELINIPLYDFLKTTPWFQSTSMGWRTGVTNFHGPINNLLMPPYVLGYWLGDGTQSGAGFTTADPEVVDAMGEYCSSVGLKLKAYANAGKAKVYGMSRGRIGGSKDSNAFYRVIRSYGLDKEKHVPRDYLVASEETRAEVLAGLLDADGHLFDNCYDIIQKSLRLAQDILFLARSLGLAAYMKKCTKGCQNEFSGTYYRIIISGHVDRIPLRVGYKKPSPRKQVKDVLHTGITVSSIGPGWFYGFEITGDGLFLLGDFTVTHNTSKVAGIAMALIGRCQFTSDAGQGAEVLIRGDAPKAVLQVDFTDYRGVERMVERHIPAQAGIRETQEIVNGWLGASPLAVEAAFCSTRFFDLSADKQRSVLWEILGEMTDQEMRDALNKRPDIKGLGDYWFGQLLPGPLAQVPPKNHYKHLCEALWSGNRRTIKDLQARLAEVQDAPPAYDGEKHYLLKSQYEDLQNAIAGYGDQQRAMRLYDAEKSRWDNSVANRRRWEGTLQAVVLRLEELEEALKENPPDALQAAYEEMTLELQSLNDAIQDALSVGKEKGPCPEVEVDGQVMVKCARKEAERAMDAVRRLTERQQTMETNRANVRSKMESMQKVAEDLAEATKDRDALRTKLEVLEVPAEPVAPEGPDVDLTALREQSNVLFVQVQEMGANKARLEAYQERAKKREASQAELEKAEKAQRYLDALRESLGPSGVKAEVMATKVAAFLEEVNAGLRGFAPRLVLDQAAWEWGAVVKGRTIGIHAASDGQKLRMSLGLQVGLAKRSGINVVTMDRAETVDIPTLHLALRFLVESQVQAFVLLVASTPQRLGVPGTTEWFVDRGNLTRLVGREELVGA